MQHIDSSAADLQTVMPKHTNPKDLTIEPNSHEQALNRPASSPITIPGVDLSSVEGGVGLTSLPALPSSPPTSPRHQQDPSKNILNSFKSGRSREGSKDRLLQDQQVLRSQARQAREADEYRPGSSSMSKIYHLKKAPGSTPELSLVGSADSSAKSSSDGVSTDQQRPQPSPQHSQDSTTSTIRKKEKPFRNPLTRSKSIRRDSESKGSRPTGLKPPTAEQPPNTAPLNSEWSNSDMGMFKSKGKEKRGKSADRTLQTDSEENLAVQHNLHAKEPKEPKESKEKNAFMSGSKNVLGKAKTGGGNFFTRLGKIGRSSSNSEKEVPDQEYQLKVITLPLVEQTRISRISKKIEASKDKTEYWMPSLPWRCIDYLNLNCESEGLYRVPGSGPQVKHWQRRFDQELDVDLLDATELYDPNTIGSMLKQWLRELPTEIFPKTLQADLAKELQADNPDYHLMGQPAPQKLRDALSELPPYNYYLLFAITCHLSLLLSHQEKNRMDLNNLSICIGPCLNMDRWLFNFLVGDWRHCWQGCWTEKQTLEDEKHLEDPSYIPPSSSMSATASSHDARSFDLDERAISSGADSGYSGATLEQQIPERPRRSNDDRPRQARNKSGSRPRLSREELHDSSARAQSGGRHYGLENTKPSTYVPAGMHAPSSVSPYPDGGRTPTQQHVQDVRRPSTAEHRAGGAPAPVYTGATAPKSGRHNRSQSDLPTPSQSSFPDPFGGKR